MSKFISTSSHLHFYRLSQYIQKNDPKYPITKISKQIIAQQITIELQSSENQAEPPYFRLLLRMIKQYLSQRVPQVNIIQYESRVECSKVALALQNMINKWNYKHYRNGKIIHESPKIILNHQSSQSSFIELIHKIKTMKILKKFHCIQYYVDLEQTIVQNLSATVSQLKRLTNLTITAALRNAFMEQLFNKVEQLPFLISLSFELQHYDTKHAWHAIGMVTTCFKNCKKLRRIAFQWESTGHYLRDDDLSLIENSLSSKKGILESFRLAWSQSQCTKKKIQSFIESFEEFANLANFDFSFDKNSKIAQLGNSDIFDGISKLKNLERLCLKSVHNAQLSLKPNIATPLYTAISELTQLKHLHLTFEIPQLSSNDMVQFISQLIQVVSLKTLTFDFKKAYKVNKDTIQELILEISNLEIVQLEFLRIKLLGGNIEEKFDINGIKNKIKYLDFEY